MCRSRGLQPPQTRLLRANRLYCVIRLIRRVRRTSTWQCAWPSGLRDGRDRQLPRGVVSFVSPFPKTGRVLLVAAVCAAALCGASLFACVEVGTGPSSPAAIELPPYPSPSVVVGDTLRDLNGKVTGIHAIVRNVRGEIIADAPTRYLYADALRDSALAVDTISGVVRALRMSKGTARLAARVGTSLQVLREIIVTTRPDSVDRAGQSNFPLFTTTACTCPDFIRSCPTNTGAETAKPFVR